MSHERDEYPDNVHAPCVRRISQLEHQRATLESRLNELEEELHDLRDNDMWLAALENAGVDNWEGYSHACELLDEYRRERAEKARRDARNGSPGD